MLVVGSGTGLQMEALPGFGFQVRVRMSMKAAPVDAWVGIGHVYVTVTPG